MSLDVFLGRVRPEMCWQRHPGRNRRRGAIAVLTAVLIVMLLALVALSVDLGYVATVRTELQRAADAAALAGAGGMIQGVEDAELMAFEFLARNPINNTMLYRDQDWETYARSWLASHPDEFKIELGQWDPTRPSGNDPTRDNRFYQDPNLLPCAISVTARRTNNPLFFGRFLKQPGFDLTAQAVARYQPRDIVLALDLSGSMNFDSQLRRITDFGESARAAVETNLQEIYADLGSPQYGNLQFTPQYLTVIGQPPSSGCMPQITVTFRANDVEVVSTKDLSNVVLGFSDGSTQKFDGLSGTTGIFKGTGAYSGKKIVKVWVKSGCNESGEGPGYGERFEDNYETIKRVFGLDTVAYPYPAGSWEEYIDYVKTNSYVANAGYKKKYGYMTLINYWLEKRRMYAETPDLWKVRAQPIGAVKDAVSVFMEYINEVKTNDRVALVVYDSADQTALVEHSLTPDYAAISDTIQHRQAAHYDSMTNIGGGIEAARLELNAHGRPGAFKMIVLMTDGYANRPGSATDARNYALAQAQQTAAKRYPIIAISLGMDADTSLMEQIATITNGAHFRIQGGEQVTNYREALLAVFRRLADHRPLVLVK